MKCRLAKTQKDRKNISPTTTAIRKQTLNVPVDTVECTSSTTPIDTVNTEAETSNTETKSKILPIFVQNVTDYKNTINCHE